jgi:hypothetical protein
MRVLDFQNFLNENRQMTSEEIVDYIAAITPEESDVPDYYFSLIKKSGKRFVKQKIKIEDLLKQDKSLNDYVMSGEIRYGDEGDSEHEPLPEEIENPIVVFNGEVVDGYSRTSAKYRSGEETIEAYVST